MHTVQHLILNRENFKVDGCTWLCFATFGCCCGEKRRNKLFEKGRRKVTEDLDLRTYLKSVRNT